MIKNFITNAVKNFFTLIKLAFFAVICYVLFAFMVSRGFIDYTTGTIGFFGLLCIACFDAGKRFSFKKAKVTDED